MNIERFCKVCNILKPIQEFLSRGKYHLKTCKDCYYEQENSKRRLQYADHPTYKSEKITSVRHNRWRYKYNVEPEVVYKTLEDQDYKCANTTCRTEISLEIYEKTIKRANLDHNHKTGTFRALLCNRCNVLLGHVEKNSHIIEGLRQYTKHFNFNN